MSEIVDDMERCQALLESAGSSKDTEKKGEKIRNVALEKMSETKKRSPGSPGDDAELKSPLLGKPGSRHLMA